MINEMRKIQNANVKRWMQIVNYIVKILFLTDILFNLHDKFEKNWYNKNNTNEEIQRIRDYPFSYEFIQY